MRKLILSLFIVLIQFPIWAQIKDAPERTEGEGPWRQLIIRGVTLINGNGAPPVGPVDIVEEQNKIVEIKTVGYPGVEIKEDKRPELKEGAKN